MPRPLIVKGLDERQRIVNRALMVGLLVWLGLHAFLFREAPDFSVLAVVVPTSLVLGALIWFAVRRAMVSEAKVFEAMQREGFAPFRGDFATGLEGWPSEGFQLFEEKPWVGGIGFDDRQRQIRVFMGSIGGDSREDVSGAAIRVPGGRFPTFSIEPSRRGLLSSTPPSTASFREDRTFAEEYAVATDDARRLERELPTEVLRLWRTMPGWRLQGNGEWILAWSDRRVGTAQVPAFVAQLGALARVLREGARADAGMQAGGR